MERKANFICGREQDSFADVLQDFFIEELSSSLCDAGSDFLAPLSRLVIVAMSKASLRDFRWIDTYLAYL